MTTPTKPRDSEWADAYANTPPAPRKRTMPGTCKQECLGGHKCCCDARYAHEWHICKRPDCECHREYEGKLAR